MDIDIFQLSIVQRNNEETAPSTQLKTNHTGMIILNNGKLLDESKSTSSKTKRFKDYATKIKTGITSSKSKSFSSFSREHFKHAAWEGTSLAPNPQELLRADGDLSKILRTYVEKDLCDWMDGIINSKVRLCIKKHTDWMAACLGDESMIKQQREAAAEELLPLILENVELSLKPGSKEAMPENCKFILSYMNKIAEERFPDERSTRWIVFTRFLFRYVLPNLVDPKQQLDIKTVSYIQNIQQGLTEKLSKKPKCPNFLVPIFL